METMKTWHIISYHFKLERQVGLHAFVQGNETAELPAFSIYLLNISYDSGTELGLTFWSVSMFFINFSDV